MIIIDIFDAAIDGTYDDFMRFYSKEKLNIVEQDTKLNLLCTATCSDENPEDKLKIMRFLIDEGIDINFKDAKKKRTALHVFFSTVWKSNPSYFLEVCELLINSGIDINAKDVYGSIALSYAITLNKNTQEEMQEVYKYLIESGSDYRLKNKLDKNCIDLVNECSWRSDIIKMMEGFENE